MGILQFFFGKKTDFRQLVQDGAVIVDVRTPEEFRAGNIKGSQNIPLDRLKEHIEELRRLKKPVITVCQSGMRGSRAQSLLNENGIEAKSGGGWQQLERRIQTQT